jgi:hypothetical protein
MYKSAGAGGPQGGPSGPGAPGGGSSDEVIDAEVVTDSKAN